MPTLLDKKPSLEELLPAIACAGDEELSEIIRTIIQTYANRFPDQEILFLSLPRNDPKQRKWILNAVNDLAFE